MTQGRPGPDRAAPPSRRGRTVAILAGIVLAGLALRGSYLADLRNNPTYQRPALDAELHDYWAWGIASGDWSLPDDRNDPEISTTPYFRPPGYPWFLAAVYRVAGRSPLAPRIVQFGLGLACTVLVFLLARRLGTPVGLTAAAGTSVYWTSIYFEGELLDPSLLAFLALALLLATGRLLEGITAPRAAAAGTILGLFALVRPNVLLFLPIALVWVVRAGRGRTARRRVLVASVVLVAACAAVVAPATVRNLRVSGEWILISSNGGINLYIGNNPQADGINAAMPDIDGLTGKSGWTCFDYPQVVRGLSRRLGREVSHGEASRFWASEAASYIASHPARVLALTAKRALLFWGPAEVGEHDVELARRASPTLRSIPLHFPFVLSLAVVGALFLAAEVRRDPDRRSLPRGALALAGLVGAFVLAYFVSFLPFFFNARYRAPLLPLLFVFASFGVCRIASLARGGELRRAVLWSTAAAALWALAAVDMAGYDPRPDEWHYQLGNAYRAQGANEAAAREYLEALRIDPGHVRARNDLAVLRLRSGDTAEASRLLREVIEIDPRHADARLNLAGILVRSGRLPEAVAQYREAVSINPLESRGRVALGSALLLAGDPEGAIAEYRAALDLEPADPAPHVALGRALLTVGRPEAALESLSRALDLDPASVLAHFYSGMALSASGRTADAAARYREAIRLDPSFGPARDALARIGSDTPR